MSPEKRRQETIDFHRNYCVHYDPAGSSHGCAAGVNRDTMQKAATPGSDGKKMVMWGPCIGGHTLADPLAYCPKWERRSLESAEKRADDVEALSDMLMKAAPVINAWRAKPPRGKSEIITCPVCGGRLSLSQAACNGHVRARCDTENCISFIE